MSRLNRHVTRLEAVLATVLLISLLVPVVAQVVARYVFNAPLVGADELARFTLVWLAFVCAALVAGSREGHIAADFIQARLSKKGVVAYEVARRVLIFATCAVLAYATLQAIEFAGARSSTSLGFSMRWWYYAPLVAFVLMMLHQLANPLESRQADSDPDGEAGAPWAS